MADNRMLLLHKESQKAVIIARRSGAKWTATERLTEVMQNLFDNEDSLYELDGYELLLETKGVWSYGKLENSLRDINYS